MRTAIVNSIRQGIRQSIRGLGEPVPSLFLDLQDSLQPTMSNTVNPGTFTRATEATYYDHEGLVRTAKSGQARMAGSRVPENLITASEDMTNAAYTLDTSVTSTATTVTFTGTAADFIYQEVAITDDGSGAGGRTFVFSAYVSLVSGTVSTDSAVKFSLRGDAITNVDTNIGLEITSTPQRFSVTASTDAGGTTVWPMILCDDAITITATKWQLEEVTGQTNQNPSEYVSTGVLSGTYHGLGVDGVKAFTTLNGNTVSSGVVTEATGPSVAQQWVELEGVSGTYASTPDNAANSVTGDITLIAWVALDDYATGSAQNIVGKWNVTGNNRSYLLQVDASGNLKGYISAGGTGSANAVSDAPSLVNGVGYWIRMSWSNSDDEATFYTSKDPLGIAIDSISWTQIGSAKELVRSGIYAGTSVVEVGTNGAGVNGPAQGKISRAVVIPSTDPTATPVADFNANDYDAGKTWESTSTSEVWTLNGNANIVGPLARWGDFPGAAGDSFSAPDSAANSITADISLIAWVAMDDWTPPAQSSILNKWTLTGNQRSYAFSIETDGTIEVVTSSDGAGGGSLTASTSTAPTGFADGTGHWVGAAWDSSEGTINFYTSDSPASTAYSKIAWTPLGDANVAHSASGIFDSTGLLEVGGLNVGASSNVAGKIARAAVFASTDLGANTTPAADFDARTFTPGVSTAKASTGEVWTANGNVSIEQNIPSNWDSDGPLGYLAEESRENILLQSNGFDTTWTNNNSTETANYAVAPDGTKTAWRLIDDGLGGSGSCYVEQTSVTVSSGSNTFSVYYKADQLSWGLLQHFGFDNQGATYFNLATGEVGTINANHSDAGIEYVGDGWYRVWVVFSTTTDLVGAFRVWISDGDLDSIVDRDGTSSVLIWGAQVEAGDFPTSYIPTTTTSVTRNADALEYNLTVTDPLTASFEPTPMVSSAVLPAVQSPMSLDGGALDDRYAFNYVAGVGFRLFVRDGGLSQANIDTPTQSTAGVTETIAFAAGTNDFAAYKDGAAGTTDTSGSVPEEDVTTVHVGANYENDFQFNGTIRKVKIFNKRLTDSQVSNL